MGLYRHPHLVRGVVHTPEGAFRIDRGLVEVPEEVGDALGWKQIDDDHAAVSHGQRAASRPTDPDHAGA